MTEASALDSSVLVLNRFYAAVRVVPARRAFALLCKEAAEVVDVGEQNRLDSYNFESWKELSQYHAQFEAQREPSDWVRCVSFDIKVPRVIRLLVYDRLPHRGVKFNRRNIFARDGNRCQYCGKKFPLSELSIDHVIPKSRGGKTSWTNVACACTGCNKHKAGRTPKEANMRLLKKPEKPRRSPVITLKLTSEKYQSWKQFVDAAYWSVSLK